jgi:hypothetical protein
MVAPDQKKSQLKRGRLFLAKCESAVRRLYQAQHVMVKYTETGNDHLGSVTRALAEEIYV